VMAPPTTAMSRMLEKIHDTPGCGSVVTSSTPPAARHSHTLAGANQRSAADCAVCLLTAGLARHSRQPAKQQGP
jgi:hypothetical protein